MIKVYKKRKTLDFKGFSSDSNIQKDSEKNIPLS